LPVGFGRSYFIGSSLTDIVKLDVYYTDKFMSPIVLEENIRMASIEEITAMKVEVVSHGGRKKDFWDLHELLNRFPISEMLNLHQQRYPWNHNREGILEKFLDFEFANDDLEPICLRNKQWDIIKLDWMDEIERFPG
jgi:hypothetical protein